MRLPRFKTPSGIVRNAENFKHTILRAGIVFFHHAMNSHGMNRLGKSRLFGRAVAGYREFADLNKERMDMLEFLCDIIAEPSEHLTQRCSPATMAGLQSSRLLVQENTQGWVDLEVVRWQKYFQPTKKQLLKFEDVKNSKTEQGAESVSIAQKEREKAIAQILGAFLGTPRELRNKSMEEIGSSWVYSVALSRAFRTVLDHNVSESAWQQILPSVQAFHSPGRTMAAIDSSKLHNEIWAVMRKVMVYDPLVALALGRRLNEYCHDRNWAYFPLVTTARPKATFF